MIDFENDRVDLHHWYADSRLDELHTALKHLKNFEDYLQVQAMKLLGLARNSLLFLLISRNFSISQH